MKATIDLSIPKSHKHYDNLEDIVTEEAEINTIQNLNPKHNMDIFSKRFTWKAICFSVLALAILTDLLIQYTPTKSEEFPSTLKAPAKRVVIFYTDGTKADALYGFYSNGTARAPYIRDVILNEGSFGVSYTGLPTETRTCATMMLSGHHLQLREIFDLYFIHQTQSDHIFNKSEHTIAFGMEEIIGLFKEPKTPTNVEFYPFKNLSTDLNDHTRETDNVMGQFLGYLQDAKLNSNLAQNLTDDKLIILLHLVSVDSSGHEFGGLSPEYEAQISYLDGMISKAVKAVQEYYQDDNTAFILTSDHGMREIKLHTGNGDNVVRTPIVAWGAGVVKSEKETVIGETHDEYSTPWNFEGIKRKDILQIDIPSLAASLIGVPFPQNSEGKIPLQYLDLSEAEKAEESYRNAKQLCSAYQNRKLMMDEKLPFSSWEDTTGCKDRLDSINKLIEEKNYPAALYSGSHLINDTFNKIQELKLSERNTQIVLIVVTVYCWLCLSFESFFKISQTDVVVENKSKPFIWFLLAFVGSFYLISKGSPFYHFIYLILPLYLARNFFLSQSYYNFKTLSFKSVMLIILYLGIAYIFSYSFNMRKDILAVCFGFWALFTFADYRADRGLLTLSILATVFIVQMLVNFALAEVNYPVLVFIGAITISLFSFAGMFYYSSKRSFILIPIVNVFSGVLVLLYQYWKDLVEKMDVEVEKYEDILITGHEVMRIVNILLMVVLFFIFKKFLKRHSEAWIPKIVILFSLLAPFYILESISFETLFYVGFAVILTLWTKGELSIIKEKENISIANSLKLFIGYQILFQMAYFGYGNASTYDRFNLDVNYRFFSQFDPLKMGTLMLIKNSIPYLMLNYAFQMIAKKKFNNISPLFMSLVGLAGPFITMMWLSFPSKPDYRHPTLQIAYPIICSCLILTNIAMARVSNFLLST